MPQGQISIDHVAGRIGQRGVQRNIVAFLETVHQMERSNPHASSRLTDSSMSVVGRHEQPETSRARSNGLGDPPKPNQPEPVPETRRVIQGRSCIHSPPLMKRYHRGNNFRAIASRKAIV